jgi:hypothetical protein
MKYINRAIDIIRENSKAVIIYLIYSFLVSYLLPYIFNIDFYSYSKEKFDIYYKMPSFYILLLVEYIFSAFFLGGLWYSIAVKRVENASEYFEKSIYFFNRFIILSFISLLFVISILVISLILHISRFLFILFIFIYILVSFYIGIKISFTSIFIVKNDERILQAFKNSFSMINGNYFLIIFVASIIKYPFIAKLSFIMDFLYLIFIYILFEIASSKPEENQVETESKA